MPAEEFTKKADTAKKKRQWEHVYLGMKKAGKSPEAAIRGANSAVKKQGRRG